MTITHILFDLHGTLVDSDQRLPACYAAELGNYMAGRFGGAAEDWAQANRRIVADWDSYYADLDFTGDRGLDDMWEGMLRTTRALFRLTKTAEPDLHTLTTLSRELPYYATRKCDAFYGDVRPTLERLRTAGYTVGLASHTTLAQAKGTLEGGGMTDLVNGPLLCSDVVGCFGKSAAFYRAAGLNPQNSLIVDDQAEGIGGAKAAGMRAVQILRKAVRVHPQADHVLQGDLRELINYLGL